MTVFKEDILKGRVALITGGGTGIGKEIATLLGRHGADIIITSRKQRILDQARLELEREGINCMAIAADVRNPIEVENVVREALGTHNRINIVINNAAGNFPALLDQISYNGFKTIVDIDLIGTYNVTKAVFDATMKSTGGCIVNISAPFQHWGVSFQGHVAAAKTGVDSLTRTCAVEWASLGIRVNSVAPGGIAETEGMLRFNAEVDGCQDQSLLGSKGDIANAVLFLVSDAASYISGVCLRVDGGSGIDMLKIPIDYSAL
jgi:2,4-dienoyl-CoA reductase [(3E)-enoyl-CoA-producing], peroxisomal